MKAGKRFACKGCRLMAVLGVVVILTAQGAFAEDESRRAARTVVVDEVVGFFRKTLVDSCEEVVSFWKEAQSFEKLALAQELLDNLESSEKCRIFRYKWTPGTDDMSRVAGRAKWALEQIIGVKLANVTPESSEEDLRRLRSDASRLLQAYRNGVLSVAGDGETSAEDLKKLKEKYAGRIKPGISLKAPEYSRAMHQLLLEWSPIGRRIADLADIIGAHGRRTEYGICYGFDTGYGGVEYQFSVAGGKIMSVRVYGLN
jgi:hypothetical protein